MEFEFSFNDATKEITLYYIKGNDFRLSLSDRNHTLTTISIPYYECSVYDDMSGQLIVYTGGNWNKDKKRFLGHRGIHTKMQGRDKWYLQYSLQPYKPKEKCENSEIQHNKFLRSKKLQELFGFEKGVFDTFENNYYKEYFFLNDDDCGREYSAGINDCQYYRLSDIEYYIYNWVYKNVLGYIKNLPIPEFLPTYKIFKEPKNKKIKYNLPDLFLSCRNSTKYEDHYNNICNENKLEVCPSFRLSSLNEDLSKIKNPLKELTYEGFVWCLKEYDRKPSRFDKNEGKPFFKISLKYSNEVYVIDVSGDKTKEEVIETFKPIDEYNGEYKEEIFLVCRNIRTEELVLNERLKNKLYGKK
jgi:hypothetical protein